jgi:hypothetical protein
VKQTALWTFFSPFSRLDSQLGTTSSAKLVCPVPVHNLNCPGRYPEEILIQTTVYLTQALKTHPRWGYSPFRQPDGITMAVIEPAKIVLIQWRQPQLCKFNKTRDAD